MNRTRNKTGFTLIELLVALAMVATIVSMVYGSYAATSRSLEVYDSRLGCSQRAHLVLRLMTRQIRCAYAHIEPNDAQASPPQTAKTLVKTEQKVTATTSRTRIKKADPVFCGDPHNARGEVLRFLTTAGLAAGSAPQRLACTRYRYDRTSKTLSIDRAAGTGRLGNQDPTPQWQVLLENVQSIELAFHNGRQWQPSWNATADKGLPRAVRIELTVIDKTGREYDLETTASVGYRVAPSPQTGKRAMAGKKS